MAIENASPESGGDDLRSELERAFANPSAEPAASEILPEETTPDPLAAPEAPETPAPVEGERARDERGRFAPKQAEAKPAVAPVQQAKPEAAPAPPQAKPEQKPTDYIPPPSAWTDPKLVTKWQALPKEVRAEIAKRETQISEMERGFSGVAQILAPRAQRLAAAYGSPEQGLNVLFQLSDFADRDPAGFVQFFLQQRQIDPRRLFQQPSGQQPPQGAAPQDATGNQDEINWLKRELQALKGQQSQASERVYLDQIEAFSRDPSRPYFNAVRGRMAALLQSESAKTLEEAYEQATWADPHVRQEILAQEQAKADAERKAKVDAARKAQQANINGSAPVGLVADANPDSLRGTIVSAWNASTGRV